MLSIEHYNLKKGEFIEITSPLCSAACSLEETVSIGELTGELQALTFSYYNQWRFVLESYEKLYNFFNELNNSNAEGNATNLTEFDIKSLHLEPDFKNFTYLFIISLKTVLDSFTCLVDIIQNQIPRKTFYPDFHNYLTKKEPENSVIEIKREFRKMRKAKKGYWITTLTKVRNNMIHGGYLLKPNVGFKQSPSLLVRPYKGNDFYSEDLIDIGKLFDGFITGMPKMENSIVNIFLEKTSVFPYGLTHQSSYKFSDLINHYEVKEIIKD